MIKYAVKYLKNTFVPLNGANELDNLDGKLILVRTDKGEEVLKAFLVNTEIGKLFENSKKTPPTFEFLRVMTQEDMMIYEEIKKEEKKDKDWVESPLKEIPRELPALTRASKVLKKIDKYYEKGNSFEEDVAALQKAVDGLKSCVPFTYDRELSAIMADMLLRLSDIARIAKISQEQILTDRIEDLIEKYE